MSVRSRTNRVGGYQLAPKSAPTQRSWPLRTALLGALLLAPACSSPQRRRPHHARRDPAVSELDRVLARPGADDLDACLGKLAATSRCSTATRPQRIIDVDVALDPRYQRWSSWRRRLERTFSCANRLYAETAVQWRIASLTAWDPGEQRHQLYPLLDRLQRELPALDGAYRLGITVWEKRRIYTMSGGEIGLSQGSACVVPSWPRIENDCIILAHELGHLIGAKHVPGKHWVMGWAAHPFHLPADDPLGRVVATYRFHPRNVAAIDAHRTARLTAGGLQLDPGCREYVGRLDRCYGL